VITYLLTPRSRGLSEKLTVPQLIKNSPAFYETRRFITAFTTAGHLSLSWARSVQSMNLIQLLENLLQYYPLIYAWVFQMVSFSQVSPSNPVLYLSPLRVTCPVQLSLLDPITRMTFGEEYRVWCSSLCSLLHFHVTSSVLGPNILLSTLFSKILSLRTFLNVTDHVPHPHKTTGEIIVLYILIRSTARFLNFEYCFMFYCEQEAKVWVPETLSPKFYFADHILCIRL
jgi:hypothetical protein